MDHQLPIVESQGPDGLSAGYARTLDLRWPSEAATQSFAQTLAGAPALGQAFVTLHGDLGAGKTTLARHLLQALGVTGRIKSPTYAIVEAYETDNFPVWHFDFYRFNDPQEWEDAGFRDIFASPGLKLVEWPQKAQGLLPQADLDIAITTDSETARRVAVCSHTPLGGALLAALSVPVALGAAAQPGTAA